MRDDTGIADPATLSPDQQLIYIDAITDLVLVKIAVRDPKVAMTWRDQIVGDVTSRIGEIDFEVAASVDQSFGIY